MKKKPLISIVITYYKKKDFIKKTLESILNQTYKNYEVIFVYDQEEKKDLEFVSRQVFNYYVNDPSNQNDKFLRIRVRKLLFELEKEGLDKIFKKSGFEWRL